MTMKYRLFAVTLLIGGLVAASGVSAKTPNSQAGTSAFSFLKIDVGARAVGMGGAFTGLADDEAALYYNPAGIATLETDRVMFTYHNYVEDLQSGFLGYVHRLSPKRSLAGFISYLNYGDFVETDLSGNETGTFGGGDLLLGCTYALQQSDRLSVGGSAKFIYEKIQNYSATGVAVDLGVKYITDRQRWGGGAMVQNLGAQLSSLGSTKNRLPITFRAGGFTRPRDLNLLLTADVIVPIDNSPAVAIGGEYVYLKPLYLRMGWNSFGANYRASDSNDKVAGLTFGVGFNHKQWQISYAFAPAADLGDTHRITLSAGFGQ
jgi:hypothetical protein